MPADTSAPDRPVDRSIQTLTEQAGLQWEPGDGHPHPTDFHDALTFTLYKAERLTAHLVQQLEALDEQVDHTYAGDVDPFALSLLANHLNEHLARLRVQAGAWQQFDWQMSRRKKGGRAPRRT